MPPTSPTTPPSRSPKPGWGRLCLLIALATACQPAPSPAGTTTAGPPSPVAPPAGPTPSAPVTVGADSGGSPTGSAFPDPAATGAVWPMRRRLDQSGIQAVSRGLGAWPAGIAATPEGFWFTARYPGRVYRYEFGVLLGSHALDQDVTLEGAAAAGPGVLFTDVDRGLLYRWVRGTPPVALNRASTRIGSDTIPASTGDGGPLQNAQFDAPVAVAAGADGSIVVAEAGSGRIRRVDAQGTVTTIAQDLLAPAGVAIGADGAVTIADSGAGKLLRWTAQAGLQTLAESVLAPDGLAVDPSGTVWVTDGRPQQVLAFRPDGTRQSYRLEGITAPGAISATDRLLVIDRATSSIWEGHLP